MINEIKNQINREQSKRVVKAFNRFQSLIKELNTREIPDEIVKQINSDVDIIDSFSGTDKEIAKLINKTTTKTLELLRKELNLVPHQYYQNLWMAIGLAAFGAPIGVIWFAITQNPAFISIGIPLGLPIGIAVGASIDKKAAKEGRQLEFNPNK